eukprot:1729919-Prymnesium_polylepis.1
MGRGVWAAQLTRRARERSCPCGTAAHARGVCAWAPPHPHDRVARRLLEADDDGLAVPRQRHRRVWQLERLID